MRPISTDTGGLREVETKVGGEEEKGGKKV